MPEPGLELEERERLLGVEELGGDGRASPMAGNRPARIALRDARLSAEGGDQAVIQEVLPHAAPTAGEEDVDHVAGLRIEQRRLPGTLPLPGADRLAHEGVDRLGERRARLLHRDVEEADGALGQHLVRTCDRHVVALPADAAHP